ncbi:MAG TPA: maleylacetoacetate isomerase [Polyangiaceae bacterium]|nr:maleylacetoacetate isomerase [Polyangiaceae bacterium]
MRLYSYWRSSSAWRVRIALAWKRLPHELELVHLGQGKQHAAAYVELNPLAQVPMLEIEEKGALLRLTQSMAIIEYLDERFPERPVLPRDRGERARARQLAEIVNSGIQPMQNLALQHELEQANFDVAPLRKQAITRGLGALEAIARESAGRFLVRDGVTLADIYLVPQLFSARRFGVDLEPFPTLRRVDAECSALAEFQSAHPNAQPDSEPQA